MAEEKTFEQALAELENAVSRLEEGQMPLDEALDCFEAGVKSANLCRKKLQAVESRVEVLMKDVSGEYSTEDFLVENDEV
jgi:exodeoxyribonuclease VII small subunit